MSRIIEEIEVGVPIRVAYDQWTQFESFPRFMEGIDRVLQLDDTTLEWTASIGGRVKHWRAEIVEQRPDDIVAWRSTEGAHNDGAVRFESLGSARTRVILQLERRVRGDLERFRDFVESRGQATGAWRGRVDDGRVRADGSAGRDG
jgi:uncharacterized membrane protein